MAKTSIHIEPCKTAVSELHNTRAKALDYVRPELSSQNAQWVNESIAGALSRIQAEYQKNVGQRMQAKASPIKEGVIVLDPNESNKVLMSRLQDFSSRIKEKFGIKTIQTYIHRDEGHIDEKGEWKENCHAHMVFDWTNDKGKSLRLNSKVDFPQIQTILAECLHMERGESSDVKHLNSIQYKLQEEQKRLVSKKSESLDISRNIETQTTELEALKTKKNITNKDVQSLEQERIDLQTSIKILRREKDALTKETTPLKTSFLQKVEIATNNLKEMGLSALSASEKDSIITKLQIERDNAKAEFSALREKFPYAVEEKNSHLNQEIQDLKKEVKEFDVLLKTFMITQKERDELKESVKTLKERNSLLSEILPPLPKKLLEIGFALKQVVDLVKGKAKTILNPNQELRLNSHIYAARGGEEAELIEFTNKSGKTAHTIEIDGKNLVSEAKRQSEEKEKQESKKKGRGI